MTTNKLTPEQLKIIQHPMGNHARIMAVAGAGKTSTMVQLVKRYLDYGVPGKSIQVLMFNRLARSEFQDRMNALQPEGSSKPQINTFHSFAYRIIRDIERNGLDVREIENWSEDESERTDYFLRKIISDLEKQQVIPPMVIDLETARTAISLWKSEMVPPDHDRAKSSGHPGLVDVYIQFEKQRIERNAYTMDDLIPRAVNALKNSASLREKWASNFRLVVVDEYQDVNYAQQQLLECLVGESTDLVVVGDDDQTIYEWRGARPEFILNVMSGSFNNRPVIDYTLSRSFRFGPELAQAAHNVISLNQTRFVKPLVAFNHTQDTQVHLVRELITSKNSLNDQLFHHLRQVLIMTGDASKVIILGRTYNQLMNLEAICLIRKVPYTMVGSQPFYKRSELITLIDYLRLVLLAHNPLTAASCSILEKIINRPNRYINVDGFSSLLRGAMGDRMTPLTLLDYVTSDTNSAFDARRKDKLENLRFALAQAYQKITEGIKANVILQSIVDITKYLEHFTNFYGNGEESKVRLDSINALIALAARQNMTVEEFIEFFDQLDCTQGTSEEDAHKYVLVFTTIYRTKGLEYDYVFVPEVMQGSMPVASGSELFVWDAARSDGPGASTSQLDNERRLFYVALTRAKKAAYLGINQTEKQAVSQFVEEMHLDATKEIMRCVRESNGTLTQNIRAVLRQVGASLALRAQLYEYYPNDREQLDALFAQEDISTWPEVQPNVPVAATQQPVAKPVVQPKKWWEDD
jgi:DNA helicase II / ATP-dependent DNA helicase PcrA